MRYVFYSLCVLSLIPMVGFAQPHYTLFMYNKAIYNAAYTGSREVLSLNGTYRDQWSGIDGAPKVYSATIDGPIGTYKGSLRKVALGVSFSSEAIGVEHNNTVMAYYAYRIKTGNSTLSFGLNGGVQLYSANYGQLTLGQQNDPNFAGNVKNALLPNFGAGVYWSGEKFYLGASVPNLLENYYDKNEKQLNNQQARQIRSYYASGGYVITLSESVKLQPQFIVRYTGNATYKLPVNTDLNLSMIIYDRLLVGATYRTDQSFEGIVHMQVTPQLNIGYAYDYLLSALNGYAKGAHELVIGFDLIHEPSKYTSPRFIKTF